MTEPEQLPEEFFIDNLEVEQQQEQSRLRRFGSLALSGTIVGAAGFSWIFQIGPWNEALRIDQATRVLEETLDANQVALTVASITTAIELTSASLIALGLNTGNGLIDWFKNRKKGKEMIRDAEEAVADQESKASKIGSFTADIALSMGAGAGVVTVRHHIKDKENKKRLGKDLLVGAAATVPVTALSGFVGYTAAQSIITGGESDWFGSEYVVDYGTSNKFWLSVLGVGYVGAYAYKKIKNFMDRKQNEDIASSGEEQVESDNNVISLFGRSQVAENSQEG